MFTGIIEDVGVLAERKPMPSGHRIRIESGLANSLAAGDSLAVNGVCLTVILNGSGELYADIGPETARVTTLASLQRGHRINLERALRVDGRLGGHLVLGHVDGVGLVEEVRPDADCAWVTVAYPPELAPYLIRKGSVAVDGVSLTIAGLGDERFDLQIIPYTWTHTAFQNLQVGDRVNLECDMIGKYVMRAIELSDAARKAHRS